MWRDTELDPGGSESVNPSNEETSQEEQKAQLDELKDQSEQQQKLIGQLKEMLRKTDQVATSASTLEKAEKLSSTLNKMQTRAKRNKQKKLLDDSDSKAPREEQETGKATTPGKEKVNLLRKQLEENRAKLAERGKHQKGIEDKVSQLKAQLDDSQAIVNQSISNILLQQQQQTELKSIPIKPEYSIETPSQELFLIVNDKDRQINELNSRIQQLQGNVLDLQENLKEKDSVIEARTKAITLMSEDLSRRGKSTLDMLDETKEEMRRMQENFVILEMEMKNENIKLNTELTDKSQALLDLEAENEALIVAKANLQMQLDEGNKSDLELENKNLELVNQIQSLLEQMHKLNQEANDYQLKESDYKEQIRDLSQEIKELKKTDSTPNDNFKKQLDEMNKSMIKLKAQNKAKIKELQKQLDVFKKDDVNAELLKVNKENESLKHKIVELEEEKGNLQLNLMELDTKKDGEPNFEAALNELKYELEQVQKISEEKEQKLIELTNDRANLLRELESCHEKLEEFNNRLAELRLIENEQVRTELTSAQLEEQIDHLKTKNNDLLTQVETISNENIALHERIETILSEKQEINSKIEHLIHENMELVDRLEKLSAEKVSSAESIEIVESLTQQEKLELAEYNQKYSEPDHEDIHGSIQELEPELNDSVTKLSEESNELMEKIELFTIERKEVMEKMEQLTIENSQLHEKLNNLEQEKNQLEETYERVFDEKSKLELESENWKQSDLDYYKNLVNEQTLEINDLKNQIIRSQDLCKKLGVEKSTLEDEIQDVLKENESLNETLGVNQSEIVSLKSSLDHFKDNETESSSLRVEIEELTEQLMINSSKVEGYEEQMSSLNNELQTIKTQVYENDLLLQQKETQIQTIQQESQEKVLENQKLQNELQEKNQEIQKIIGNFQTKYEQLQTNIESNMTEKNDKMKKCMGHLKKKTAQYEDLESRYKEKEQIITELQKAIENMSHDKQELEEEQARLLQQIEEFKSKQVMEDVVAQLRNELEILKHEKIQEVELLTNDKNNQIAELQKLNESFQTQLNEVTNNLQQTSEALYQKDRELNSQRQHLDATNAKQQEQQMVIENYELHIASLVQKNQQYDNVIAELEHNNAELQLNVTQMEQEINKKVHELDEYLNSHLNFEKERETLQLNLRNAEMRISELTTENYELQEQTQVCNNNIHILQQEINNIEIKHNELNFDRIQQLEDFNSKLQSELTRMETELRKSQIDLKSERDSRQSEIDKYETDSNNQYEVFEQQRHKLQEVNDKLLQELNDVQNKIYEIENECKYAQEQNKEYELQTHHIRENYDTKINELQQVIKEKSIEIDQLEVNYNNLMDRMNETNAHYETVIAKQEKMILPQEETLIKVIDYKSEASIKTPIDSDLTEKIKVLQFMLHDSEKSKDDAIAICQELLIELTRREYENSTKQPKPPTELTPESIQEIENQIIPTDQINAKPEPVEPVFFSQNLFTNTAPTETEELFEAKVAYKCFDNQSQGDSILVETDDLWGTEEAQLEAQHVQTNDLVEKYNLLEKEHQDLIEKYKALKRNSIKTIKKLKESNKEKKQGDFSDDLDMAIVDELKLQIENWEKVVKELKQEKDKYLIERESLLKQVDVLTNANERMVEMKERQDIDVQLWQRRHQELTEKIAQIEWDIDDSFETKETKKSQNSPAHKSEMSELEKQISELTSKLNDLSSDNEELQAMLEEQCQLRNDLDKKLTENVRHYENELQNLNSVIESKQEQIQQLLEDVKQLKEQLSTLEQSQNENQANSNERENFNIQLTERENKIRELNEEILQSRELFMNQVEELTENVGRKEREIENLGIQLESKELEIKKLQEDMVNIQQHKLEVENITAGKDNEAREQEIANVKQAIQTKDSEIQMLQNELITIQQNNQIQYETEVTKFNKMLEENANEIQRLLNTIQSKDGELQMLQSHEQESLMINQLMDENQKLNVLVQSKDEQIRQLTNSEEMEQLRQFKSDNEVDLQNQLVDNQIKDEEIESLKHAQIEYEIQVQNLFIAIKSKDEEILKLKQELKMNEHYVNGLKHQLEQNEEKLNSLNETYTDNQQMETENYIEHISLKENEIVELRTQLQTKYAECQQLQSKCVELDYIVNEDTKQISDLKNIIESQVMKIEELKTVSQPKDQLNQQIVDQPKRVHFPESNELVTQHFYESSDTIASDESSNPPEIVEENPSNDLVYYMLHQRDVRCEELTNELMQLLEERDTLQLRLSNSIRTNEELRRKLESKVIESSENSPSSVNISPEMNTGASPDNRQSKTSEILLGATGAEIAKEATEEQDTNYLQNKISELHSVDYRRDVGVKQDQENRYLQLSLMQNQRDLAMLPPEAAQRLVDANYTLSRESESTSNVLLNWLWGRSTPKVDQL